MKKIFLFAVISFASLYLFAQQNSAVELDNFDPIDFVRFEKELGKETAGTAADKIAGAETASAENAKNNLLEYTIGEGAQNFTSKRAISSFEINRYETVYKLWFEVREWAETQGYFFENKGREGSQGKPGKNPSVQNQWMPVTDINWYDAIVWCNAFSQMCGLEPCYKYQNQILKDATNTAACDLVKCDFSASGFRLPTESEWEYAARKTLSGMQQGVLASGQVDSKGFDNTEIPVGEIAWFYENTDGTRRVGTAGTPFDPSSPPKPGSGNPNGSGLFDMSGNVLEWVFDWYADYSDSEDKNYCGPEFGSERVMRGGGWNIYTLFLGAGDRYSFNPAEKFNYFGFRIARNAF